MDAKTFNSQIISTDGIAVSSKGETLNSDLIATEDKLKASEAANEGLRELINQLTDRILVLEEKLNLKSGHTLLPDTKVKDSLAFQRPNKDFSGGSSFQAGENKLQAGENYLLPKENYPRVEENNPHLKENYPHVEENDLLPKENYPHPGENYPQVEENDPHPGENYPHVGENYSHVEENDSHVGENYPHVEENYSYPEENDPLPGGDCSRPKKSYSSPGGDYPPVGGSCLNPGVDYGGPGENQFQSDVIISHPGRGNSKAKSETQSLKAQQRQRMAEYLEKYNSLRNNIPIDIRRRKKSLRLFAKLAAEYPELPFPGPEKVTVITSAEEIYLNVIQSRLEKMFQEKLAKKYKSDVFLSKAARVMIAISNRHIATRQELVLESKIPAKTQDKIVALLKKLNLMKSLQNRNYHHYTITLAGKSFMKEMETFK